MKYELWTRAYIELNNIMYSVRKTNAKTMQFFYFYINLLTVIVQQMCNQVICVGVLWTMNFALKYYNYEKFRLLIFLYYKN